MYALSTKTTDKTRNDTLHRTQALHESTHESTVSGKSDVAENIQTTSRPSAET